MHPVLRRSLVGMVCVGGLLSPAWGQQLRLLDCAQIQFFAPACVPVLPGEAVAPPVQPPEPLFRPETMAPDTPPLLLKLLEEPTLANAEAFVTWQQERQARINAVQQLLRQVTRTSLLPPRRGVYDALPR